MITGNAHFTQDMTQNMNEDVLISLAATGDSDARHVLATRLKKLRWMGHDEAARRLMSKTKTRLPHAVTPLAIERETD